jgi:hypothetical protein
VEFDIAPGVGDRGMAYMGDISELEYKYAGTMSHQAPPRPVPAEENILQAIDVVLGQCAASQMASPDAAVEAIMKGLQKSRTMVQEHWPLPDFVKSQLNIGPVAAKNIADWNDDLATSLMTIHHVLKYDGDSVYRILGAPQG